ncbi:MAG: hypothetical protein ACXVP2_05145 [Tumebacillaceae bacterium]
MVLANTLEEIEKEFDFTDSIVSDIRWENQMFDLVLYVFYYWDLQEGRERARTLKVTFKDCLRTNFRMTRRLLELPKEEIHADSWFTIVGFDGMYDSELIRQYEDQGIIQVEIRTLDYHQPWLTVVCKGIQVEE